jgi:hypothetical protein
LDQFLKIRLGWSELSIPARSLSRWRPNILSYLENKQKGRREARDLHDFDKLIIMKMSLSLFPPFRDGYIMPWHDERTSVPKCARVSERAGLACISSLYYSAWSIEFINSHVMAAQYAGSVVGQCPSSWQEPKPGWDEMRRDDHHKRESHESLCPCPSLPWLS